METGSTDSLVEKKVQERNWCPFFEISNSRFPIEQSSDWRETLPKCVSDDSRHFIFRRRKKNRNFERPFTPRGWLQPASNFGKTRFRWSPTFHFSTAQTLFATKIFVANNFSSTVRKNFQQRACFGGAVQVYTPMSNAAREFIARTIGFSLLRPLAEG